MIGQLAISRENNEHLMLTTGKSFLVFDRVDSLIPFAELDEITASQIRETANEFLDPEKLNQLIFE